MAIFYVRPLATGNNDGSNWDNAWVTIESALTKSDYKKGDQIYLHGIEYSNRDYYIAGAVNTMVEFVAVDETGTPNENSFYIIDGTAHTSPAFFTFSSGGAQRRTLKNIVFQNFNSIFTYSNTSAGLPYFVKCYFILCSGAIIVGGAGAAYPSFFSCVFWLCNMIASGTVTYVSLEDCIAYNISQLSYNTGSFSAYNCRFIKITTGIVPSSKGNVSLINCLIEECANRAVFTFGKRYYFFNGCRFNRCGTGIYIAANAEIYLQSCRFNQNTNDLEYHSYGYLNQLGANEFGGDVEEFVDVANLDYRLIGGAKLRNDTVSWLSLPTPIPLVPLIRYHAGAHERDIIYPDITSISPSVVPETGGTEITIAMENGGATGATSVTVGGTACTGVVVDSDTQLRATTPAKVAAQYDVVVVSPAGTATAVKGITAQAGASAPGAFTLSVLEWGANRARLSWTPSSGAESFAIYRNDELIQTVTANFFYIDKPTAGTIEYYVKATNGTGSTDSNTVEIEIGLGGIERRAWTYFKDTMQTDPDLLAYITKWKFNRAQEQFTEAMCPLFVAFVDGIEQGQYLGVPKQRTDTVIIKVSGKVASSGDNADTELLKIDEMIRNALEKTLQLAPAWFTVSFGNSQFAWLNDQVQEVNIDVRLQLPRFTAGNR